MESNNAGEVLHISSCSFCGKKLKDEWKFCPFCKKQVETFLCFYCGYELIPSWNYCPNCKKEIKAEQKNRQRVDKCNEWLRDILKG